MSAPGRAADVAGTYFEAWQAGDFARLRSVLADDVTFDGPLGHASNADEWIAGLKRMSQIVTAIIVHKTFIDGPDVLTWFDLLVERVARRPPATGVTAEIRAVSVPFPRTLLSTA